MVREKQYQVQEGSFCYREEDSAVEITGYAGSAARLQIPDRIGGFPVRRVGRKAFWNSRQLERVSVPETVEWIGDWAFASCRALEEIKLPGKNIRFGYKVFQNSMRLKRLFLGQRNPYLARLAATAAVQLEASYLLDLDTIGSREWFYALDARILETLQEPEEAVVKNLVYCAEEDMSAKEEACLRQSVCRKTEIALQRLLCPDGLPETVQKQLAEYLCRETKAAWEAVKQSREDKLLYCAKMIEIGAVNRQNIGDMLDDLDETQVELRAFLLKQWPAMTASSAIWRTLEL